MNKIKSNDLIIYSYEKKCYTCMKETTILTYITYGDSPKESLVFPWSKNRILKNQNVKAHMMDQGTEYYSINVLGEVKELDEKLMKIYPNYIKNRYSAMTGLTYSMNLCRKCGSKQGYNFVYKDIDKLIQNGVKIKIEKIIKL